MTDTEDDERRAAAAAAALQSKEDEQKRRRRCTGGGIEALPEEVLVDILLRVGSLKDVFMFAVTSRLWVRRFTDPTFLRGLCPGGGEGARARLLGFILQKIGFRSQWHASVLAPTFLPAPGSPLGSTERALASLVADDDGAFKHAEPLAARRGIILMELAPRTLEPMMKKETICLLGFCNPITGERHIPSPLKVRSPIGIRADVCSYAIITIADDLKLPPPPSAGGRFFSLSQLLVITAKNPYYKHKLHVHSYSAATRSWSAPTKCLGTSGFSVVGDRSAVVHQGAAHWLCADGGGGGPLDDKKQLYKLSVEVGTARVMSPSLTALHIRGSGKPVLSVSTDGKLVIASVYFAHVTVWTQQQDDDDSWPRSAVFRIPPAAMPYEVPSEDWFSLSRGSMLGFFRSGAVFIIDLNNKVLEKVMDGFLPLLPDDQRRDLTAVPYELDLVDFFMLHLGGLSMQR